MENKLYNQPPYNTEYNAPPTAYGNANYPAYPQGPPPPYFQEYPPPGVNPNATAVPVTGYYMSGPGVPPTAPPPVGFITTTTTTTVSPALIPNEEHNETEATNFGSSFSDKNIRRAFVRKVYLILMVQLLFTFGIVALFYFQKDVKNFVRQTPAVYYASYAVFLVTYLTLVCCASVRRRYPLNVICLTIFTAAMAYMTGTITSFYDTQTVFIAAGMCAGVCLGITLLSMWSKFDVTGCGMFIAIAGLSLFWFGIMCIWFYNDVVYTVYCALFTVLMMMFDITGCGIYLAVAGWVLFFFGIFAIIFRNHFMYTLYSGLFALLMMMYLAYDTQLIMGGRRYEISPEEHIIAALSLYLDIVYIFIILLGLLGRGK